jgi:subtilisin family serine protease
MVVKFRENAANTIEMGLAEGGAVGELKLSDSLDKLNNKYGLKKAKPLFKSFKRKRQQVQALLKKDEDALTKKEKQVVRRLKRAPRDAKVPDLSRIYKLELRLEAGQSLEEVVAAYNEDPDVEYAELNYVVSINSKPNDVLYPIQWPLSNIGQMYPESGKYHSPPGTPDCDIDAPEAWDVHTGSGDVIVAVVDSGVDYKHRDLAGNMWVNTGEIGGNGVDDDGNGYIDDVYGYDFCTWQGKTRDSDPVDDHGHGTHCSGIIGAAGDNWLDISGVCWKTRIMALKYLHSSGWGSTDDAVAAFYYAVQNGAEVISNSWGGGAYSQALEEAVEYAHSQGVIMVASAGNNNVATPQYPAHYEHMVAVAATNSNDEKAPFSNYGDWVDIAAPGVDVLSLRAAGTSRGTVFDNYTTIISGSSAACPHVAGACALLLSHNPTLTSAEVYETLMGTVDAISPGICLSDGRLNLYHAVMGVGNYLIAEAGPDECFKEIRAVTLDGSASYFPDPDGVKEFQWTQTAGTPVELGDPCAMVTTFMPEVSHVYLFELVISDGSNTSEPDEVLVAVGNRPPVADAGPNMQRGVGQRVNLDGTGSYDPDCGEELTYSWTQLQGPNVVLQDGNSATAYFDCTAEGIHVFELVVSDGIEDSVPSLVQVTACPEFPVNTYTDNNQEAPAIAMDSKGNFVVVWQSYKQDGSRYGAYGQRFSSRGEPLGGEFQVSTTTSGYQYRCDVAVDTAGNFVVVWEGQDGSNHGIFARLYDANGQPVTGEFVVNTYTDGQQTDPRVGMNSDGAFVVVWQSWHAWGPGYFDGQWWAAGRVYDAAGVPQTDEFVITELPHGYTPDVVMDGSGDFVITWLRTGGSNAPPPSGRYVRFRRYDADGTPKEDAAEITGDLIVMAIPGIAMDAAGNFIITWWGHPSDWEESDIYAQRFDSDGISMGEAFAVNTYPVGLQGMPSVTMHPSGSFVIVWVSRGQDGSDFGVFGQLYDSDGVPIGEEFQLNSYVAANQSNPYIAMAQSGRFVTVWESEGQDGSGCGIFGRFGQFPMPPIEVAMKFTPQALNPGSEGRWMKLHFVLPEGYGVEDVDVNEPAECRLMDTGETIESEYVNIFVNDEGLVEVEAGFERSAFALCLSQPAERTVTVMGMLAGTGGQDFYGTDTIKIINKGLERIAALASYWLAEGCGEPDWCGGFDIDHNGVVNFADFALAGGCDVAVSNE